MIRITALLVFLLFPLSVFGYSDFIQSKNQDIPVERAEELSSLVNQYAKQYDVPADMIISVMWQESRFKNVSSNVDVDPKSCGYMQVSTRTASWLTEREVTCQDLIMNPELNIQLGTQYLARMKEKQGTLVGAVYRYNGKGDSALRYAFEALKKFWEVKEWSSNREIQ